MPRRGGGTPPRSELQRARAGCEVGPSYWCGPTRQQLTKMRDILKLLNDRTAGDLRELSDEELDRLETLCDQWRTLVALERARRASLPAKSTSRCRADQARLQLTLKRRWVCLPERRWRRSKFQNVNHPGPHILLRDWTAIFWLVASVVAVFLSVSVTTPLLALGTFRSWLLRHK